MAKRGAFKVGDIVSISSDFDPKGKYAGRKFTIERLPYGRNQVNALVADGKLKVRVKPAILKHATVSAGAGTSTTTKKTPTTKKTAAPAKSNGNSGSGELVKMIVSAIESGALDSDILTIDDALTTRANTRITEQNEKAAAESAKQKTAEQKAEAPKRNTAAKKKVMVVPVEGKTYTLDEGIKRAGGAKVKFVRFIKSNSDNVVVAMVNGVPGAPKGQQIKVPIASLREIPARKSPAKKSAKTSASKPAARKTAAKGKK